jgi:DNA-binding MarR family transcriptional regulator
MTDINDLMITDYQALAEFRYRIRRFLRFSEKAARQAGLESQHHQLMLAVKGAGEEAGPSIAYIAERLQLQHHSAVELVDRLVNRGLIKKSRRGADRREVQVKLTPRGERILTQLTLHHREELRTLAPALVTTLRKIMVTTHARYQVGKEEQARTDGTERRNSR